MRLRSILLGLLLLLSFSALPRQQASADDVEQRIAEFWKRVEAIGPSGVLTAADLGQWALNVTQRDPGAGITVADFRAATAAMQEAFDRAGVGVPPGTPRSSDVEGRIARFWQKLDALGPGDVVTAADLGQWALNVTDRDPNKRIRVADFRASTAGMQGGLDRARSLPRPAAPVIATPTPTPTPRPTPSPTPTATPQRTIALGQTVTGSIAPYGQDRWTFAGSAGQRVRIELSGFDTVLRLLDAGERTIATNDDRASNDHGSLIEVTLPSTGTYTIVAAGYDANSGTYRLTLSSALAATPTPGLTATPAPAARPTPAPPSPTPTGIVLTDGRDATVACGTGATRVDATVSGIRSGLNGLIVGDTATIVATAPSGTYLRWVFGGHGTLTINGCTAWYTVASIGTAYQTSATISISRAAAPTPTLTPTPTPTPTCPPGTPAFRCGSTTVPGRPDASTPAPVTGGGEGGPRLVVIDKTIRINVYDPANQPGGTSCGNEYLQVSLSGPYSYSVNVFWVNGPGTNYLWAGPYNNARTFQPITPGRYQIAVDWADGEAANYFATVGQCRSARVIKSKQGWGVPVP